MATSIRAHLTRNLAKKVEAYGIVVWVDPEREYDSVAPAVSPDGTRFTRWDGSWYALRREIEALVSGPTPPALIIYQPVETPQEDPLAEVRDAGTVFRRRLATLIRDSLQGLLTDVRIEELAAQARTLPQVEAALAGGAGVGVRLPAALGTADALQLALRILADDTDAVLAKEDLWGEAGDVLRTTFGGVPVGEGAGLRDSLFRHLLVEELREALGDLPADLSPGANGSASKEQRRRACELLRIWRSDRTRLKSYRERALRAERDLGLPELLSWIEGMQGLDSVPTLERLALGRVIDLLSAGKADEASALAERRRTQSLWSRGELPESDLWAPTWEAAASVARLGAVIARFPVLSKATADDILIWYAEGGWSVDQAHRRMEAALTEVPAYAELEEPVREVRGTYESWLETLLERFTTAVGKEGIAAPSLLRQGSVHKELVSNAEGPVAYLLVDALRFELGVELEAALRAGDAEVELHPALGAPPTITPVGMANLMPGAELGLRLLLSPKDSLEVLVAGTQVRGVGDRVSLLRAAHGDVVDLLLTEIFDQGESDLRERIGGARLVLVRSQEIDEAFESDKTAAAWGYVKAIRSLVVRAVARLSAAGVGRFVIAPDHGFLILSRALKTARVIDGPGGRGELHRRCWIGKGGTTSASAIRVPLGDLGVEGDLDLIVPRGLAIFSTGGARRFFHGGLSPQELLIPVIQVQTRVSGPAGKPKVKAEIAAGKIMTGVFSAALSFEPDLFAPELHVRVVPRNKAGEQVARIATGDGYDEETGSILLGGQHPQVLTFRVTSPLVKGDRVLLEIYDAGSDRLIGKSSEAAVVAEVRVGDDLD